MFVKGPVRYVFIIVGPFWITNIVPRPVWLVIEDVVPLIVMGPPTDTEPDESAIWDLATYNSETNAVLETINGDPVVVVEVYWKALIDPEAVNELILAFVKKGLIIVGPVWITNTVPRPLWLVIDDVVPVIVIGPVIDPSNVPEVSAIWALAEYKEETNVLLETINGDPVVVVLTNWEPLTNDAEFKEPDRPRPPKITNEPVPELVEGIVDNNETWPKIFNELLLMNVWEPVE